MFNRSLTLACLFTWLPIVALAQGSSVGAQPYTFIGPGAVSGGGTMLAVGGGFDVVHRSGLGVGTELGFVGPFPDGFDYGIGLFSLGVSYRWRPGDRVVPFVSAGPTWAVIRCSGQGWNAGGGVVYLRGDGFGFGVVM